MRDTGKIGSGGSLEGYLRTPLPLSVTPQQVEDTDENVSPFYLADDRIGIGGSPDSNVLMHLFGKGATSATISALIENSLGDELFSLPDNGNPSFSIENGANGIDDGFVLKESGGGVGRLNIMKKTGGQWVIASGTTSDIDSQQLEIDASTFMLSGATNFKIQGGQFLSTGSNIWLKASEFNSNTEVSVSIADTTSANYHKFEYVIPSSTEKSHRTFVVTLPANNSGEYSTGVDYETMIGSYVGQLLQAQLANQRLVGLVVDPDFDENAQTGIEKVGLELPQDEGIALKQLGSNASVHLEASEIYMGNLPLVAGATGTIYVDGGGFLKLA